MIIYSDIETLPTADTVVIKRLADKIKAPATYKKPESIAEWERDNKPQAIREAVAKTSFDGLYGRICVIGYAFDDGEPLAAYGDDEADVLRAFFADVEAHTTTPSERGPVSVPAMFCGHNLAAFDLPFIKHRAIIHGIKPPAALLKAMASKPWDGCIADTMLMWSTDREKRVSMDALCNALGINGKDGFDGSMVAETWPDDPQKVVAYCMDDVRRTQAIYKRLTWS